MNAKTAEKKKLRKEKLDIFFDILIPSCCAYSEESEQYISNPNRTNICHIFPKRIYHSVEDNLTNHVLLTFDEHTRFDDLLDKLDFEQLEKEFKNSWSIVCLRAKKLLPLLKERGSLRIKFEDIFNG